MACHVNKHSPDSRKESKVSLLIGLGNGYFYILLSQIGPKSKVLSSQIAFCAHTTRIAMCRWRDVIAGSSAPISANRNLFSQNQYEIASTGKRIVMVGRPEALSQSLPSFRYRLSVDCLDKASTAYGMEISAEKTKLLTYNTTSVAST